MTVAAEIPLALYDGDGVTVAFPAPWRYIDTAHLKVEVISAAGVATVKVLGTHYTATAGATDAGGTVTMVTPPASGETLRIRRVTPRAQTAAYPTTGAFPARSHELALDRQMLALQETDGEVGDVQARALQVPFGEVAAELPSAAVRGGKIFAFDGGGRGLFDIDAEKVRDLIGAVFNPIFTTLASLVMFLQAGANALARTVQDKLRERVTPQDFGAVGDGVADDTEALNKCLTAALAQGKVAYLDGTFRITSQINFLDISTPFRVAGRRSATIKLTTDNISAVVVRGAVPIDIEWDGVSVRGPWADNPRQSGSDNWLLRFDNYSSLKFKNSKVGSSTKGGIKGYGTKANFEDNEIYECARGGINIASSSITKFTGNIFRNLGDDAISLHTTNRNNPGVPFAHQVIGNYFEDCQGVAALGARSIIISNNVARRIRTRFWSGGFDSSWSEGLSSPTAVMVIDNVIVDCLDYQNIANSPSTANFLFWFSPTSMSAGGTLPEAPGEAIPTSGGIVPVYGNTGFSGTGSINSGGRGVIIARNTFIRTLPAVAAYADWGFGLMFRDTGYFNPPVTSGQLSPRITFGDSIRGMSFEDNDLTGLSSIRFLFNSSYGYRDVSVRRNKMKAFTQNIFDTNVSSAGTYPFDVVFEDNDIDGDPFYTATGRATDGSWAAAGNLTLFNLPYLTGWRYGGNNIKNVSRIENVTGGQRWATKRNQLFGQLVSASFSTSNKGIGQPISAYRGYDLVDYDCDSASASFRTVQTEPGSKSSIPTTGFYLVGMLIENSGSSRHTPDASGMLLEGWRRKTTGSAHVLGTDWEPVYTSKNSPAT